MLYKTFTLILMLICCFSCSDSYLSNTDSTKSLITSIDISNASQIYLGDVKNHNISKRNIHDSSNCLLKITDSGYVEEVNYTVQDSNGNITRKTDALKPSEIIPLTEKYCILVFSRDNHNFTGYNAFNYIVNTKTGECYILSDHILPIYSYNPNYGYRILEDKQGNAYFCAYIYPPSEACYPALCKINLTNPQSVSIEIMSLNGDNLIYDDYNFAISGYGDIVYNGFDQISRVSRIIKNDGSFDNIKEGYYFTDFDGNLYSINNSVSKLNPITNQWEKYLNFQDNPNRILKVENKDRIAVLGTDRIQEVYSSKEIKEAKSLSEIGLKSCKIALSSKDYYYLAGKSIDTNHDVLLKIDPITYEKELLVGNEYDITYLNVTNDNVTFSGLRKKDGAKVLCKIIDNEIIVIDESLEKFVVYLENISVK